MPPNGLLFSAKILRHGSHFGQKKFLRHRGFPFRKNREKIGKISHFEVEKPLENGSRFAKISKKSFKSAVF